MEMQFLEHKEYCSMGTQTEDYGCENGCTSIHINTNPSTISTSSAETLLQEKSSDLSLQGYDNDESQPYVVDVNVQRVTIKLEPTEQLDFTNMTHQNLDDQPKPYLANAEGNRSPRFTKTIQQHNFGKPDSIQDTNPNVTIQMETTEQQDFTDLSHENLDDQAQPCVVHAQAPSSMVTMQQQSFAESVSEQGYTDDQQHSDNIKVDHRDNVDDKHSTASQNIVENEQDQNQGKEGTYLKTNNLEHTEFQQETDREVNGFCTGVTYTGNIVENNSNNDCGVQYADRPPSSLMCSFCGKQFQYKSQHVLHLRTHTGEKPYECSFCSEKFTHKRTLDSHVKRHTGEKPFECPHCRKTYSQKCSLSQHLKFHSNDKPYRCSICTKAFTIKSNLDNHLKVHDKEKHFECSICDKKFRRKDHLAIHVRTHTGEKPFGCNYCDRKFSHKNTLNDHVRQHTGETPYGCSSCGRKFKQKSGFRNHNCKLHTERAIGNDGNC